MSTNKLVPHKSLHRDTSQVYSSSPQGEAQPPSLEKEGDWLWQHTLRQSYTVP